MESSSTPRVTVPFLNSHIGRTVIIVGKVVQLRGDEADIEADGIVSASLNRDTHLVPNNGVQIIGKVNRDLSVKILNALDLGTNVDYELANTTAEISQQYKDIHGEVQ